MEKKNRNNDQENGPIMKKDVEILRRSDACWKHCLKSDFPDLLSAHPMPRRSSQPSTRCCDLPGDLWTRYLTLNHIFGPVDDLFLWRSIYTDMEETH